MIQKLKMKEKYCTKLTLKKVKGNKCINAIVGKKFFSISDGAYGQAVNNSYTFTVSLYTGYGFNWLFVFYTK